jgi:5-methyltetrahydropteroyltriglutamate--homocysteine methyltransferase
VSLECIHSHVPVELLRLLKGKDVLVGVIDVASDQIETPARSPTPSAPL